MSSVPDRVVSDLRERDAREAEAERAWAAYEPRARQELLDLLLSDTPKGPGIDTAIEFFLDDVPDALGADWQAFRGAIANGRDRDDTELGRIVRRALERAAREYVNSKPGQAWIANRVYSIYHDAKSEYSE